MNIKRFVVSLINKHGTNDPYEIADGYDDIYIIKHPLGDTVRGYYQYFRDSRIIYINASLDTRAQKVVCAHELGHAFLHTKVNIVFTRSKTFFSCDAYEREANLFAVELLLPDNIYREYNGYSYEQIAAAERLPAELVRIKYENF